jgi:protein O-GlcNAc transferase
VLRAVPTSRLILYSHEPDATRDVQVAALASHGIDVAARVERVFKQPRMRYLDTYNRIDIGLDPLPYNGHFTSCDAFWMGVPVVSLRGQTSVGRGGASLLNNLELTELLAADADDYVAIAASLASDLDRLAGLRAGLRERMRRSPLCDAATFTRSVEAAYRSMWRQWCAGFKSQR